MSRIKRAMHVIFNPITEKWEVWELTQIEAFDLEQKRFGVDVALYNLSYDERRKHIDEDDNEQPTGPS